MPTRVQLRRTKGWRKPAGAVVVARPSKWGNPFRVMGDLTRADVVAAFRDYLEHRGGHSAYPSDEEIRSALAGRDLACWCPLDQPCHADVLLEFANAATHET